MWRAGKGQEWDGMGEGRKDERGGRECVPRRAARVCVCVCVHLSRLWQSGQWCTFLISRSSPLCLHTLQAASSDGVTWISDRPVAMHAGNSLSQRGHDVHQSGTPSLHFGHDT